VGSVKRCKNVKCGRIFYPTWNENSAEYCKECRSDRERKKHQRFKEKFQGRGVGNPQQDNSIMLFLRKKREIEDTKYKDI
jgi:hypothetical protein